MADTTEGDTDVLYLGLLAPALIALIAGLVIHSFIIGVNVSDWWRGRSVTPVDHIVTSLGISRMCSQSVITLDMILLILVSYLQSEVILAIMDTLFVFFTCSNIWLTSLLSIVLCLKISNLHTRLFLYLRRMILHRTGCLIVASVIISIFNSLLTLFLSIIKITNGQTYNTTLQDCIHFNSAYTLTSGAFFPLVFYSISSVLLFVSLYHHTTRMKMSSNLSINLETYYSVMRLVSITFIYNTLYLFGHIFCLLYYYLNCVATPWLYVVLVILPVLHSSYLIYRTTKLRNQMSKVLQNMMDFLSHRKNTETIEKIEVVDC